MWVLFATGFGLGLAYAAVPGPVDAETIRRDLSGGFRPALLVQPGAMLGDTLWAVLGLTGAVALSESDGLSALPELLGAGFLLVVAHGTFRSALVSPAGADVAVAMVDTAHGRARPCHHLAVGAMFSLASPVGLAFWAGLDGGLLITIGSPSPAELGFVLGSFMVAVVAWALMLAAGVALGRRRATAVPAPGSGNRARPGLVRSSVALVDSAAGFRVVAARPRPLRLTPWASGHGGPTPAGKPSVRWMLAWSADQRRGVASTSTSPPWRPSNQRTPGFSSVMPSWKQVEAGGTVLGVAGGDRVLDELRPQDPRAGVAPAGEPVVAPVAVAIAGHDGQILETAAHDVAQVPVTGAGAGRAIWRERE